MSKQSHIERTANEPRDSSLHTLTISRITQVTPTIRLFRLAIPPDATIQFLPGQWLDLHPPPHANIPKPGGFTITSAPSVALAPARPSPSPPSPDPGPKPEQDHDEPHLELAIQSSPSNPPAAYLFLPAAQLLHTPVRVRVGGSFVFPPPFLSSNSSSSSSSSSSSNNKDGSGGGGSAISTATAVLRKVVLVAGGMGINPLMSMLSSIAEQGGEKGGWEVRVLYGVRGSGGGCHGDGGGEGEGGEILFLERIAGLFCSGRVRGGLRLFLTGGGASGDGEGETGQGGVVRCRGGAEVPFTRRRMTVGDVEKAVGEEDKEVAVVYVCGVPAMTDEFVEALVSPEGFGMDKSRVLYEKWW